MPAADPNLIKAYWVKEVGSSVDTNKVRVAKAENIRTVRSTPRPNRSPQRHKHRTALSMVTQHGKALTRQSGKRSPPERPAMISNPPSS